MPDRRGNPSDNEGKIFVAGAQRWPMAPSPWFDKHHATYLECPSCHNTWVGVIVSSGPFIQLFCPKCGFAWGPMEMHKPQMTESAASRMGIKAVGKVNIIEEDFDLDKKDLPDE